MRITFDKRINYRPSSPRRGERFPCFHDWCRSVSNLPSVSVTFAVMIFPCKAFLAPGVQSHDNFRLAYFISNAACPRHTLERSSSISFLQSVSWRLFSSCALFVFRLSDRQESVLNLKVWQFFNWSYRYYILSKRLHKRRNQSASVQLFPRLPDWPQTLKVTSSFCFAHVNCFRRITAFCRILPFTANKPQEFSALKVFVECRLLETSYAAEPTMFLEGINLPF